MGAKLDGKTPKVKLTGGQAPRIAGLMLKGPAAVSTAGPREVIDRYRHDLLAEHDRVANGGNGAADNLEPQRQDALEASESDPAWHIDDDDDWANDPIEDN